MAMIEKIDSGRGIPNGDAVVGAGPKIQEDDPNRILETGHEGPDISYVNAKYDSRFQES